MVIEHLSDTPSKLKARLLNESISRWPAYFVKAIVLVLAFCLIGCFAPSTPPVALACVWAVLSIASAIGASYHFIIKKMRNRYGLKSGGGLARLNSGRIVSMIVTFAVSVICLGNLILELPKWELAEWLMLVLAVPLYFAIYRGITRIVAREYEPLLQVSRTVLFSEAILCALLLIAYLICCLAFQPEQYASTTEAFLQAKQPFRHSPSTLLEDAGYFTSLTDGLTAFAMSKVAEGSCAAYVVLRVVCCFATVVGISNLIGTCSFEMKELQLLFLPLGSAAEPTGDASPRKRYVALACALPVLLVVGSVALDVKYSEIAETEECTAVRAFIRDQVGMAACVIDGKPYDYEKVHNLLDEARGQSNELAEDCARALTPLINEAYDQRIANVDAYLDWYYSLPADYERLIQYFTGELEDGLRAQLSNQLNQGVDDSLLESEWDFYKEQSGELKETIEAKLPMYKLDDYDVDMQWLIVPVETLKADLFDEPLAPTERLVDNWERIGLSAGVGVATGFVAARVVERVSEKAVFKEMLSKLTEKLAMRGLLAATGTTIAPIVGTAIGVGAGFAADFFLLKADEAMNREGYKAEIVAALDESRNQMLDAVGASASAE